MDTLGNTGKKKNKITVTLLGQPPINILIYILSDYL